MMVMTTIIVVELRLNYNELIDSNYVNGDNDNHDNELWLPKCVIIIITF